MLAAEHHVGGRLYGMLGSWTGLWISERLRGPFRFQLWVHHYLTAHHLGFTDTINSILWTPNRCPYPVFMFVQKGVLVVRKQCLFQLKQLSYNSEGRIKWKRKSTSEVVRKTELSMYVCASLFLPCTQIHLYHSSRLHTCVQVGCLLFSFWLTSLCMTDSWPIHISTDDSFLHFYDYVILLWDVYYILFIHLSVVGHLGWFHVLAIVNGAAVNIGVHVSWVHAQEWDCWVMW